MTTKCESVVIDEAGRVLVRWDAHNVDEYASVEVFNRECRAASLIAKQQIASGEKAALLASVADELQATGKVAEGVRTVDSAVVTEKVAVAPAQPGGK